MTEFEASRLGGGADGDIGLTLWIRETSMTVHITLRLPSNNIVGLNWILDSGFSSSFTGTLNLTIALRIGRSLHRRVYRCCPSFCTASVGHTSRRLEICQEGALCRPRVRLTWNRIRVSQDRIKLSLCAFLLARPDTSSCCIVDMPLAVVVVEGVAS